MCPWQVPRQGLSECGREGEETQSSLLCFITPFSMCLQGLLRGSWPRAEATGHSDLLCFPPAAAPKILLTAHLTCFTFLQPSHTHTNTHTDPPQHMRHLKSHTRWYTNPQSPWALSESCAFPIIPWYVSWLFPTWSTCCHIGMWPHSTPISWVPAFDFHCGLAGPLIMQRGSVRSLALITASCATANPQRPGEHVHPKLRNKASNYKHLSFKHEHIEGWKNPQLQISTNTVHEYTYITTTMGIKERPHKHFKEPPSTCVNSCPLH